MDRRELGAAIVVIVLVGAAGLVGLSLLGGNGNSEPTTVTTTTTTPVQQDDGFVPVVGFIESTFDGHGFADRPNENSTLDTTLAALELLDLLNLTDAESLEDEFNATSSVIKATQTITGYFGDVSNSEVRLRTTAMSFAVLKMMNRLDDTTLEKAVDYLLDFFRGGISWGHWLLEEPYIYQHWGLWAALQTGHIQVVTAFGPVTIADNVFNHGDDTSFAQVVLYWNESYWRTSFTSKSLAQRLLYTEDFERMIRYRHERPTLLHLMADISETITELASLYNDTTGLLSPDMLESAWRFHLMTSMGGLPSLFNVTTMDSRHEKLSEQVEEVIDIPERECNPDRSVSQIKGLTQTWLDVQYGLAHTTTAFAADKDKISGSELGILWQNAPLCASRKR